MLLTADVLKIEAKFVERMIAFLKRRKSLVDQCYCAVIPYFADAALVSLLEDCLSHTDECNLQKKADIYTPQDPVDPVITNCQDQVTATLAYTGPNTCSYTTSLVNGVNNSAYPIVVLENDSQYMNVTTDVVVSNTCNSTTITETIEGGCVYGTCSNDYLGEFNTYYTLTASADKPQSVGINNYITDLRIYAIDATGYLIPTPIDLDLNPATSDYYTASVDCPGCTTVLAADVKFSSPTFTSSFNTLMDNVSLALFGDTGRHLLSASYTTNTSMQIGCTTLHNPSAEWFGINVNDSRLRVYNPTTVTYSLKTAPTTYTTRSVRLQNEVEIETPCETLNFVIRTSTADTGPQVNYTTSNFNIINLSSVFPDQPLYGIGPTSGSCSHYTLTATYPTALVSSVEWQNSAEETLSTTNTATVYESGTYTFIISTVNGCTITNEITIP